VNALPSATLRDLYATAADNELLIISYQHSLTNQCFCAGFGFTADYGFTAVYLRLHSRLRLYSRYL